MSESPTPDSQLEDMGSSGSPRLAQSMDGEHPPRLDFPVVGIGASAGGLEAYTEFIQAMPDDSGMAFVLVQHLSPKHESMVAEILARHTKMPVNQVADEMEVKPNHVYVIRPGNTMTIRDGRLHLGESLLRPGASRPVDDFFRSLAEEQRERAIAVILSGMGSNGTAGAQAIRAVGGVCIAQDPESAKFSSMPRSMIDTGLADFILKPAEIPEVLLRYTSHPYSRGGRGVRATQREMQYINEILAVIRTRTHNDFSGYKKATLIRRIQRRMGLTQTSRLNDYGKLLRQNQAEIAALTDDMMIHVTGFFRDPDSWASLRDRVITPLIAEKENGGSIRAWVTACSTGEEAYTLGILLVEAIDAANKAIDVKIFATDMAERSLAHARLGIYPGGIESEITSERLERFFEKNDAFYRIKKELRELVVFAPQNVLQDPPFSRLDIATCRNLLIYLEPEVQRRLLSLLHFGLRDGGTLMLGTSETIGGDGLFDPIDKRHRIYRRVGPTRHGTLDFPIPHRPRHAGPPMEIRPEGRPLAQDSLAQLTQRLLLQRHTPAAVVVDRMSRIVYYHGDTQRFLEMPSGEPTRELLTLAREWLRPTLRIALQQAIEKNEPVSMRDGMMDTPAGRRRLEIAITPFDERLGSGHYLISFLEHVDSPPLALVTSGEDSPDGLRSELARVRDELQSTIEELQTSNEEMKASNEEITSINEELQSTNEELETSKEELQSLNEELTTVNAQLHAKMDELERTTNDLSSLLSSTDIAVIFLDLQFRIRRFTPAVRQLIDLIPGDIGRPMKDLAQKFSDPELLRDAKIVLDTLKPIESEVSTEDGKWFVRRVLPYRTADNRIDGVVVTFVDVTARRKMEHALSVSLSRLQLLFDVAGRLFATEDLPRAMDEFFQRLEGVIDVAGYFHYRVVSPINGKHMQLVVQRGVDEATAKQIAKVAPDEAVCSRVAETQRPIVLESVHSMSDQRTKLIRSLGVRAYACFPLITSEGVYGTMSFTRKNSDRFEAEEVSLLEAICNYIAVAIGRKHAELAIRASEERLRVMADVVPDLLWQSDAQGKIEWFNRRWFGYTGRTIEQSQGHGWLDAIANDDRESTRSAFYNAVTSGEPLKHECRITTADAQQRWFLMQALPLRNNNGEIVQWFGAASEIHDQRTAMELLRESEERLRMTIEAARMGFWDYNIVSGQVKWDAAHNRMIGLPENETLGTYERFIERVHPEDRPTVSEGLSRAILQRTDFLSEFRVVAPDGEVKWIAGYGRLLGDGGDKPLRMIGGVMDITANKRLDEERGRLLHIAEAARTEAEHANRVKDDFLATISHELRTPLAAVMLWAKLLTSEHGTMTPAQQREGLEAIEHSAQAQQNLIEDLLDTTRISTGKMRMELKEVELERVVRAAVESARPAAQAKGVDLQTHLSPDTGIVRADHDRLQQIVWNLLSNAVKFTNKGGSVSISLKRNEDQVEICVVDTGKGIAPEHLPRVFDRFVQAEVTPQRSGGGLGLGLAITRQLVELHGGNITASSPGINKGSTFTVVLPMPRVTDTKPSTAGKRISGQPLRGVHVLLAEDDETTRRGMEVVLANAGARVTCVASAPDAFEKFRSDRTDAIVSDIGLDGSDGYTLMREVREYEAQQKNGRAPALAISAFARKQDLRSAKASGFDDYLTKPVDADRLITTLQTLLKRD